MNFRPAWSCLLVLLTLLLPVAGVAAPGARIEVFPPVPDAGTRVRFEVRGEWPDACVPELDSVRIEGLDVVLHATVPASRCAGDVREYALTSEELPASTQKLVANGIHRIRFEVTRAPDTPAELHGFRLLYAGNTPDPGFAPETGFWWPERGGEFDRGGPGLGVQLEAQGGILSLGAIGYGASGASTWYFGAGALHGHTAELDLSVLSDGSGPFEPYAAPKSIDPAGGVHMELHSPSRIVLWFVRAAPDGRGLVREPMSMVRFRFSQAAAESWLGPWVVIADDNRDLPTRRISFTAIEREEGGFTLVDATGTHRMQCSVDPKRSNSPPSGCRLMDATGDAIDVDFSDIALNELRGWTGSGDRVVALKLNR